MVIVGTDFSPAAAHAVGEARLLASQLSAALEIVYVHPSERPGIWLPDHEARGWLDALGIPASGVTVRRGTPWVELVRVAEERNAQVIVVGTHGCSGFQPIALGSTTMRIALLSPRPTVLVGDRPRRDRPTAVKLPDLFDTLES